MMMNLTTLTRRARLAAAFASTLTITLASSLAMAESFTLSSPDIAGGQMLTNTFVFNGFGCSGENRSPALNWKNAPAGTRSFAVTVYDPDAPTGSGWWHWVAFNLPAATQALVQNASASKQLPAGTVESRTDYGQPGYGGACPPEGHGPHRYQFRVFALDVPSLDLPADASAALVGFMLNQHKLGVAELEAKYQR